MLQEAQWKNMVEIEKLDHIHHTSLFFFFTELTQFKCSLWNILQMDELFI